MALFNSIQKRSLRALERIEALKSERIVRIVAKALTGDDMKKSVWLRHELVAQIEFLGRTESGHLRHSKFVGTREDKDLRRVVKRNSHEEKLNVTECSFGQ